MIYNRIDITEREREILQCLAEGMTTVEVASALYLSSETVKTYRSKLMYKLDARNSFQLAIRAISYNLIETKSSVEAA